MNRCDLKEQVCHHPAKAYSMVQWYEYVVRRDIDACVEYNFGG